MQIKQFQISNYKRFNDGNEVRLESGTAVLTGRNSSGKTATLEALSLRFGNKPHRSLAKTPNDNSGSTVRLIVELTRDELLNFACGNSDSFLVPAPKSTLHFVQNILGLQNSSVGEGLLPTQHKAFVDWVFREPTHDIRVTRTISSHGVTRDGANLVALENFPQRTRQDGTSEFVRCAFRNSEIQNLGSCWGSQSEDLFPGLVSSIASRIYRFSPERFCAGVSIYGDSSVLKSDGSNLPEVLNSLQSHPVKFERFNGLVSRVLPQVRWVDARPRNPNNEIWIWHVDRKHGRDDLAIPLTDCGTGVSHVLAILYVLFTSEGSRTVLIDEPQSFLHPGAARRLMDVLGEFPHHQLVIATHSPTIISASAVRQVLCMNIDGDASISKLVLEDANHRAALLNELGARLADVYGAEDIIWVEGPTEEQCFPKIIQCLTPGLLSGTAILAVRKTGDLEGRDSERVFEIYRSLSASGSLLPPTIAFVFDRECWTQDKLRELVTKSKGLLRTTERRTYENYLLHPEAIAALLNQGDPSRDAPVTAEYVKEAIERASHDPKFQCEVTTANASPLDVFDAAKALQGLFNDVTDSRLAFVKTTHSVALTEWILKHDAEFLRPLATILKGILCTRLPTPGED